MFPQCLDTDKCLPLILSTYPRSLLTCLFWKARLIFSWWWRWSESVLVKPAAFLQTKDVHQDKELCFSVSWVTLVVGVGWMNHCGLLHAVVNASTRLIPYDVVDNVLLSTFPLYFPNCKDSCLLSAFSSGQRKVNFSHVSGISLQVWNTVL